MQAKQVHFLYAPEHSDLAQGILGDVRSSYIRWHENAPLQELEELAASESRKDALVLVLVSDNFLKSAECMKRLLAFTQEECLPMLLPVLVPGRRQAEGGDTEEYATNISTIQDTIFYRDFWYDEWIRLRKQGNLATEDELRELEARKNFSKKMQPMMNTILRHLNNALPKTLDELKADNYQLLFGKLGLNSLSDEERQMPLSVALGGIPTEQAAEEEEEEEINPEAEEIADAFSIKLPEAEEITVSLPENEEAFALELVEVEETNTNPEATESVKSSISAVLDAYRDEHEDATTETSQADLDALLLDNQQETNPQTEQENPVLTTSMATVLDNDSSDFQLAAETNIFFDIPVETPVAEEKEPVYEDFVIADVDDIDVLFVLADTETEESDYEHAAICFERVLDLDRDNGRALLGLARLYARHLHRTNDADKTYRKALLCNDENPNLYYEYAMFLQDFVPMQRRRVVELLNDTIELNPYHENAYLALAKQYATNSQAAEAKAAYLQACLLNADLRSPSLESQLQIIRHQEAINDPLPPDVVEEAALQAAPEPEEEPNPYADTVVFVSGASSGIGRATAERFIRAGYRVIINARRTERLVDFRNSFDEKQQAQITCLPFDVRNHDEMRAALLSLPEEFRNIDILINNAGLAKGSAPIHEGRWSDWETMIDTNMKALLALTREVSAQMVANKHGHIINIGSAAAKDAYPNGNVYCATKAAVDMLTRAMRLDLFAHNIRVSAVQPGMVETEFALVRYEDQERATKLYENIKPLTPEDVADTVFYVATRPEHVNIQDVLMYTRQQAHTTILDRSGK